MLLYYLRILTPKSCSLPLFFWLIYSCDSLFLLFSKHSRLIYSCDSLFLLFSKHSHLIYSCDSLFLLFSCLQLLSSNLHNSSFLISHLLTVSFFYLLFFYSTSFFPIHHAAIHQCHNTGPICLCLWHHIVFNIFLSSWTTYNMSSFIFLSTQLMFSILLQINISKASSLLLSACINVMSL